jgi:hypothetical protein
MTVCPQCHTVHGDEHSFCQRCGNPLVGEEKAPAQYCPNCSGPVFPGQNFCTECGQRVKNISGDRSSPRPAAREDLFYQSSSRRGRQRPAPTRSRFPKWLFGLLGVVILAGVYYLWPKAPSKPLVVSPALPPQTAPTTEKTDTLQRDVERLAERIRTAHMKKDMSLFLSCYSTSYPNLGELERQTYENWKNFDFKNVSYNISNLRRVGPNQAVADLVWSFQLFDNQTKSLEIRRAEVNVTFEESGGSWKIRDSKQKETG